MAAIKKHLDAVVKKVVECEKIVNPEVKIVDGSEKGDGYVAVSKALEINGTNKHVEVFLKMGPEGKKVREKGFIQSVFTQEILFYEKLLPSLKQYETDNDIPDKFTSIPKVYWTSSEDGNEIIALENIKAQGYELWDRQKVINKEHAEFVFKEYAKFHGISYAMKTKDAKLYADLTKNINDVFREFAHTIKFSEFIEKMGKKLIDLFDPVKEKCIYEYYKKFADNIRLHYYAVTLLDDKSVITHGDCWCNNMMFKYTDSDRTKPASMRLLDFQITRSGSPVQDLSNFFYSGASKEVIDNYEHYLKVYHKQLNLYTKQYGITEEVLSYEDLKAQWRKYSKHGLMLSILAIKAMLCESEERKDFSDTADDTESMFDCFDFDGKNDAEYKRRVKILIEHFYSNKLISELK